MDIFVNVIVFLAGFIAIVAMVELLSQRKGGGRRPPNPPHPPPSPPHQDQEIE